MPPQSSIVMRPKREKVSQKHQKSCMDNGVIEQDFKVKRGKFRLRYMGEIYLEDRETLELVVQKSCGCPIPINLQGRLDGALSNQV